MAAKLQIGQKVSTVVKGHKTISFAALPADQLHRDLSETYANSHPHQKAITEGLVRKVANSMLPIQFVESDGFKQFMAIADPKYDIPCRQTITRKMVDKLQMKEDSINSELDLLA